MFSNIPHHLKQKFPQKSSDQQKYVKILEAYFNFAFYSGSVIYKLKKDTKGRYRIYQNSIQKVVLNIFTYPINA